MHYEVDMSDDARRSFERLSRAVAQRIKARLDEIAASGDPFQHVKRLRGMPFFSLRVGDYRVVMDIRRNKLVIFVIRIGHRSNVYTG